MSGKDELNDDFDFIDHYGAPTDIKHEEQLDDNDVQSAINFGVVGVGGGGGKLAKAFLDLGVHKTLLVNTTEKDQPTGVPAKNMIVVPGADGVAKDAKLGKKVFQENGAVVEDALRTRFGKVDYLLVFAGGGGGTGSACPALAPIFDRYLKSVQAEGTTIFFVTSPTSQEMLNQTIRENSAQLMKDVAEYPHIILDNERQAKLLRGKVGMLSLFPVANKTFTKLLLQILKLADEPSPVQSYDGKDLERSLKTPKRAFIGSTIVTDPNQPNLGATIFQNCLNRSPCPTPKGKPKTGSILLVVTPEMADDPEISKHLDAAISYVGGRADTLFSGVYVRDNLPGLVAILMLNGLE
jgi:cell division GTPase FtsZ